jgi:RNA polymerase sigma factor (sigma-70 family)
MSENDWLAERFQADREHLRSVAYRMLGSTSEADDAVQETWIRLSGADTTAVENLTGWLTTVTSRVCLDMLRSRNSRRENVEDSDISRSIESLPIQGQGVNPEDEAVLGDSVGAALLVVLDTLAPAERLAFVLHDMFGMSFEEIAPIVKRSPTAARQLASRARRRVQGNGASVDAETARQRVIVDAFLAASRKGDLQGLIAVLDPTAVMRADPAAVEGAAKNQDRGAPALSAEIHGARAVSEVFAGRARVARAALIDGGLGATWAPGGVPRAIWTLTIVDDLIVEIEMFFDASHIEELQVELLER